MTKIITVFISYLSSDGDFAVHKKEKTGFEEQVMTTQNSQENDIKCLLKTGKYF